MITGGSLLIVVVLLMVAVLLDAHEFEQVARGPRSQDPQDR